MLRQKSEENDENCQGDQQVEELVENLNQPSTDSLPEDLTKDSSFEEIIEDEPVVEEKVKKTKKKPKKKKTQQTCEKVEPVEDFVELHEALYTAIVANQQQGLRDALELVKATIPSASNRAKWINAPVKGNEHDQTYLHLAAKNNALNSITVSTVTLFLKDFWPYCL